MKRPNENAIMCDADKQTCGRSSIQKELGLALLLGNENILDMLERMGPLLGEKAQRIAALRKYAEYEDRPMQRQMPLTELQRLEKQLETIKKLNINMDLDKIIHMVRMGDEISRKGAAALLPMLTGGADPMMSMLVNMMMNGGDMGDIMGGAKNGGIMNYLLNLMGKGGAAL